MRSIWSSYLNEDRRIIFAIDMSVMCAEQTFIKIIVLFQMFKVRG